MLRRFLDILGIPYEEEAIEVVARKSEGFPIYLYFVAIDLDYLRREGRDVILDRSMAERIPMGMRAYVRKILDNVLYGASDPDKKSIILTLLCLSDMPQHETHEYHLMLLGEECRRLYDSKNEEVFRRIWNYLVPNKILRSRRLPHDAWVDFLLGETEIIGSSYYVVSVRNEFPPDKRDEIIRKTLVRSWNTSIKEYVSGHIKNAYRILYFILRKYSINTPKILNTSWDTIIGFLKDGEKRENEIALIARESLSYVPANEIARVYRRGLPEITSVVENLTRESEDLIKSEIQATIRKMEEKLGKIEPIKIEAIPIREIKKPFDLLENTMSRYDNSMAKKIASIVILQGIYDGKKQIWEKLDMLQKIDKKLRVLDPTIDLEKKLSILEKANIEVLSEIFRELLWFNEDYRNKLLEVARSKEKNSGLILLHIALKELNYYMQEGTPPPVLSWKWPENINLHTVLNELPITVISKPEQPSTFAFSSLSRLGYLLGIPPEETPLFHLKKTYTPPNDKILDELREKILLINQINANIVLIGEAGIGKTTHLYVACKIAIELGILPIVVRSRDRPLYFPLGTIGISDKFPLNLLTKSRGIITTAKLDEFWDFYMRLHEKDKMKIIPILIDAMEYKRAKEFIKKLINVRPMPPPFAPDDYLIDELIERSGGNPLYIESLILDVGLNRETIEKIPPRYAARVYGETRLPETMKGTLSIFFHLISMAGGVTSDELKRLWGIARGYGIMLNESPPQSYEQATRFLKYDGEKYIVPPKVFVATEQIFKESLEKIHVEKEQLVDILKTAEIGAKFNPTLIARRILKIITNRKYMSYDEIQNKIAELPNIEMETIKKEAEKSGEFILTEDGIYSKTYVYANIKSALEKYGYVDIDDLEESLNIPKKQLIEILMGITEPFSPSFFGKPSPPPLTPPTPVKHETKRWYPKGSIQNLIKRLKNIDLHERMLSDLAKKFRIHREDLKTIIRHMNYIILPFNADHIILDKEKLESQRQKIISELRQRLDTIRTAKEAALRILLRRVKQLALRTHEKLIFKIIIYGPSLSGKTILLKKFFEEIHNVGIFKHGKLRLIADESGRTIYFDYLPIYAADNITFQIVTVPGQRRHKTQRRIILSEKKFHR